MVYSFNFTSLIFLNYLISQQISQHINKCYFKTSRILAIPIRIEAACQDKIPTTIKVQITYVQYRKTLLSDNLSIALSTFKIRLKFTYGLPLMCLSGGHKKTRDATSWVFCFVFSLFTFSQNNLNHL